MNLKVLREQFGITIAEAAKASSTPVRTYIRYENNETYGNALKRKAIFDLINSKYQITESHGILSINKIQELVTNTFNKYDRKIDFCYLFGSYAKGYASDSSDIDLLVATSLKGIDFVGLSEELHNVLHKNIDLIRFDNIGNNPSLLSEIMKDGVKIYG